MTRHLLKKINKKNKLRIKCAKHPLNRILKKRYKKLCSQLKKEIPLCRDLFYSNKFNLVKGNLRGEWQVVNSILNKSSSSKMPSKIRFAGSLVTNKLDIANIFNNYFANIAHKLQPQSSSPLCTGCKSNYTLPKQ